MNWLVLAFTGLISLSIMSFLITFLTRKGYPVSFILLGIVTVLIVFYFIQTFVAHQYTFNFSPSIIGLLILMGILSGIGNYCVYQAANIAPNAGLAVGIAGMQSVIVTILAVTFLRDKMSVFQLVGLLLSVVAIFLMSMGSTKNNASKSPVAQADTITAKK